MRERIMLPVQRVSISRLIQHLPDGFELMLAHQIATAHHLAMTIAARAGQFAGHVQS